EELGIRSGHFLDLGTGPGTQAIALARRGFRVTAIDFSRTAVEKAIALAKKERVGVEFRRDDILSSRLETEFDYILDRVERLPPEGFFGSGSELTIHTVERAGLEGEDIHSQRTSQTPGKNGPVHVPLRHILLFRVQPRSTPLFIDFDKPT
ncbi:MAG: class I SAM-dependent methyltransferase, partial [Candidatus Aminicenantales bacterium]